MKQIKISRQGQQVSLKLYNNSWYNSGASIVKRTLWYFVNASILNSSWLPISSVKILILRSFGARVGTGVTIKPKVNIKYPWLLEIGNSCWIGEEVWIDNLTWVKIGNNVSLSQGSMLLTGNHNYKKVTFDLLVGEIILQEGVWIGAKAIVCPGVICHNHAVLTVGSVATKNMNEYTIYQGNPALPIKNREFE